MFWAFVFITIIVFIIVSDIGRDPRDAENRKRARLARNEAELRERQADAERYKSFPLRIVTWATWGFAVTILALSIINRW